MKFLEIKMKYLLHCLVVFTEHKLILQQQQLGAQLSAEDGRL